MNKSMTLVVLFAFILCSEVLLYIELESPNIFSVLNNYLTLIASLATIYAAVYAINTMRLFKKQKRAEILGQLSREADEKIYYIHRKLSFVYYEVRLCGKDFNEENTYEYNFKYLRTTIKEITDDEEFLSRCINFDKELDNIYILTNENGRKLISETIESLRGFIGSLMCIVELLDYNVDYIRIEPDFFIKNIDKNQLIFKKLDININQLRSLLKDNFLYL